MDCFKKGKEQNKVALTKETNEIKLKTKKIV